VLPRVPLTSPHHIAADTWLIPNLAPAGPDVYVPANSMLSRGSEPVVVDTGAPVHRDHWFEQLFSLVEPEDIRWVFLSHDDGDHMGNLHELLDLCPSATLVANFFIHKRQTLERALPLTRMRWVGPGESFQAGDRRLHLVVPPIFDGPTTRGLYDEKTAVLWAVDSFCALTPGAVHEAADIPGDLFDETFTLLNSLTSPWHQWLDPVRYRRHVDSVEGLGLAAVASAHGPVLSGDAIPDAFDRVRAMAGEPIAVPPGQPLLDELVAAALAEVTT
jgi:flavorubredoxin